MRVAAIVLAAGRGARMGREKMLVPYRGKALVQHALDKLVGLDAVVLVVKPGMELPAMACTVVENPDFAQGMSTSLHVGLRAVEADLYLLCLADMPEVPVSVVDALLEAHTRTNKPIVLPVHQGRRGHPVLVAASLRDALLAITGDRGARELIAAHPELVETVEVDHPGVLFDIDTPADLANATREGP